MRAGLAVVACAFLACGGVEESAMPADVAVDAPRDAIVDDTRDAPSDVDPTCLAADGSCKLECRGVMNIADLYGTCARRAEIIGCSHHEGTCTPPDRCLYDPTTGSVAVIRCSKPPAGWIDCPDEIATWAETFVLAGTGTLPCGPSAPPGTCVVSKGATSTSTKCEAGTTCTELGCTPDHAGPITPCGSIACACTCDDPTTSTCSCYRP